VPSLYGGPYCCREDRGGCAGYRLRSSCYIEKLSVSLCEFESQLSGKESEQGIVVPDTASRRAANRRLMVADVIELCKPTSLMSRSHKMCLATESRSIGEILFRRCYPYFTAVDPERWSSCRVKARDLEALARLTSAHLRDQLGTARPHRNPPTPPHPPERFAPSPEQLRKNKLITMAVRPITGVRFPRLNGLVFAFTRTRGAALGTRAFRGLTLTLDAPTKPRPGPQHRPRYVVLFHELNRVISMGNCLFKRRIFKALTMLVMWLVGEYQEIGLTSNLQAPVSSWPTSSGKEYHHETIRQQYERTYHCDAGTASTCPEPTPATTTTSSSRRSEPLRRASKRKERQNRESAS
jgi:hypothetical protein